MRRSLLALLLIGTLMPAALPATANDAAPQIGAFDGPFTEPSVADMDSDEKCLERDDASLVCKPSAGSLALLPDGRILYWNALEATENIDLSIVAEFGTVAENDQSRVLDLAAMEWTTPAFPDGGADNDVKRPLIPGTGDLFIEEDPNRNNDGALFGADQVFLADGRLLAASGTDYYTEFGAVELQGLTQTRIFDPATDTWSQSDDLDFGRWYPTMVTQADGDVLIFSGVEKLVKPIYGDAPERSNQNVHEVELFDLETETWSQLPSSADRVLPLYPRMHLLPDGTVFYNASGQTWNPEGQDTFEALWNLAATFDPETNTWTDLGVPGVGTLDVGYRGSTFSVMLPLRPDADGRYTSASFLSAGGVLGTAPGTYLGTDFSRLTTIELGEPGPAMSTVATEPLNQRRWYGHGTVLPTGEVFLTSGADRDEVIAPGTGFAVTTPELFDPETNTWTPVAEQLNERTYHNSATLLPDGRVLVGGHNPISTLYSSNMTLPGGFSPNDGRDPSFEIYSPPYLFRGERPRILNAPATLVPGSTANIQVATGQGMPQTIESVVAVRHTAETHLVDGDQRAVELAFSQNGANLSVSVPDGNVLPPGPYMLFVNGSSDQGTIPSEAALVSATIGG
ncbi:hypothetical protein BH23ACT9_BH23ACT9_08280 [soil metagenome]